MARALQLAARGLNGTAPNPRVGCVVVQGETVVGEGWHRQAGGAHAEAFALHMVAGTAWFMAFAGFALIYGRLLLHLPMAKHI